MFGKGYAHEMKSVLNLKRISLRGLSLRFLLAMLLQPTRQGTQILVNFFNQMEVLTVVMLSLSHMNTIIVHTRINNA